MTRTLSKTYLVCNECDNEISIFRLKGRRKKDGHVKHLWCFKCKEDTAHVEDNKLYGITDEFVMSENRGNIGQ